MQLHLEDDDDEPMYLADILQMWIEGIESEIPTLATTSGIDAHWSLYHLRKQLGAAQSIRLRLSMER